MLQIVDLKVRSLDVESKEVSWAFDGSSDPLDYTIQVLRSESPEGPFDAVTGLFEDRYLFVDHRIPQGDKFRQLYYRLRVTEKRSSKTYDTPSASQQPEPDLVAQAIRKHEMTIFTAVIGRACWLFKVRTFGPFCRSCFDPGLGKRTRENCLDCFDVGYLRGYHNPIEVWVQIDPATKAQSNDPTQTKQVVITSARMSYYPEVVPGDVLVEAENKRWIVEKVESTERLRATIQQRLTLRQLELREIAYKLPLNLDVALRDVQPSPSRMYENPTDLNAAIERRTPNIFAAYTTFPRIKEE